MPASNKIVVAVRCRPINRREEAFVDGARCLTMKGTHTMLSGKPVGKEDKSFNFDYSFWSAEPGDAQFATQVDVYECLGLGVLENAFKGYNACIFAYGQTGSGKTFTMMGPQSDRGLIPRICDELFTRIEDKTTSDLSFKVECSYMEIYNERVRDLLGGMGKKKETLRVREHKVLGPYVENLQTFAVQDFHAIAALLDEGNQSRVTASTTMNDQSSRSHAVFTMIVTQAETDEATGQVGEKTSRISLVDLAGSERVGKTGAEGDRLKEGGSINKSLSTLGLVISTLADISSGKKAAGSFVPYRDSVLTWLLKENLGGNSRTIMVATVSPSLENYEETLSTLRYADRAKRIETHAVVNEDANARCIRELRDEVGRLRLMLNGTLPIAADTEVADLRDRLAESERLMRELSMSWEDKLRIANQMLQEREKRLKELGISVQDQGIAVDHSKFYLLNLHVEPGTHELLMYHLKDAVNRVGSAAGQDVKLEGLKPKHCLLPIENNEVSVIPCEDAEVHVDDELVPPNEKRVLKHGCRLTLGHKEFRITCPRAASATATNSRSNTEVIDETALVKNLKGSWPGSPLHQAAEDGDVGVCRLLVTKGHDPMSGESKLKRTPLHLAADKGHLDVCKFLLESGARANASDEQGYAPIHCSADSGHLDVTKFLVQQGAHVDAKSNSGCIPLHRACQMGHLEVCKFLFAQGSNINTQDAVKKWSPLHLAAYGGHLQVVEWLLSQGAAVEVFSHFSETPLHMAAEPGHVEVVAALLSAGANPSVPQAHGRTAFDYAFEQTAFQYLHCPTNRYQGRMQVAEMLKPITKPSKHRPLPVGSSAAGGQAQSGGSGGGSGARGRGRGGPSSGRTGRGPSGRGRSSSSTTGSSGRGGSRPSSRTTTTTGSKRPGTTRPVSSAISHTKATSSRAALSPRQQASAPSRSRSKSPKTVRSDR